MPSKNRWLVHLKSVWAKEKPKGTSYKATMTIAKKTYRKGASAGASAAEEAPREKKKPLESQIIFF